MVSICDDQSITFYSHVEVPGFCMPSSAVPFSVFACVFGCVCVCACRHVCNRKRELNISLTFLGG